MLLLLLLIYGWLGEFAEDDDACLGEFSLYCTEMVVSVLSNVGTKKRRLVLGFYFLVVKNSLLSVPWFRAS